MPTKISIITVCYNRVHSIADAMQSVLGQTYPHIEYIVIDGGSTDGTQQVIEKYRDRIATYISEPDKGMYDALNKGIKKASGDLIAILHSDDVFYTDASVAHIVKCFEDTNADLVYGNGMYITPLSTEREVIKRVYCTSPYKSCYLKFGWIPLHTTIVVKKTVFDAMGYYDTRYNIASDYDISLRWFKNDSLKKEFLNEWLVKMRLGGKSTTASLQQKKSSEDLQIIRNHQLCGYFTLACKILRKIPQYILPYIINYNKHA